tara:strand:- start:6 stop:170 length:165 start_codon:yes stop_codon:yes gene_type:complete
MRKVKNKQRTIKLAIKRGKRNIKRNRHRLSEKYKTLYQKIIAIRKEKKENRKAA